VGCEPQAVRAVARGVVRFQPPCKSSVLLTSAIASLNFSCFYKQSDVCFDNFLALAGQFCNFVSEVQTKRKKKMITAGRRLEFWREHVVTSAARLHNSRQLNAYCTTPPRVLLVCLLIYSTQQSKMRNVSINAVRIAP
jgi:hypothetical protein